jgi:hypothetical protein
MFFARFSALSPERFCGDVCVRSVLKFAGVSGVPAGLASISVLLLLFFDSMVGIEFFRLLVVFLEGSASLLFITLAFWRLALIAWLFKLI